MFPGGVGVRACRFGEKPPLSLAPTMHPESHNTSDETRAVEKLETGKATAAGESNFSVEK